MNAAHSRSDNANGSSFDEVITPAEKDHEKQRQRGQKRRNGGGFLLQTTSPLDPPLRPANDAHLDSEVAKGKRKVDAEDLVLPKRASARHRHRPRTSIGSSPLATEVLNSVSTQEGKQASTQSKNFQSIRSTGSSTGAANKIGPLVNGGPQREEFGAFGRDTQPAQIVSLALNLSESRRRNFSSGALLLPRDPSGTGRIASGGQKSLALPYSTSGGSLRQHLQQQRRISRNISPRSGRSEGSKDAGSPSSQNNRHYSRQPSPISTFAAGLSDDVVFHASDATFLRAEKARETLELCYEYRRLLQSLPTIPTPYKSRPTTSKDTEKARSEANIGLGRSYNPLQYIRNRKVRFRERRPLDAEADGWKNLEKVRNWVDIVKSEREVGISRADDRFPLPSFDIVELGPSNVDDLEASSLAHLKGSSGKKPARPRLDWTVTPWDLLADARWLDQDDNEYHIEDSAGNKVFSSRNDRRGERPTTSPEPVKYSIRQSGSLTRNNASPERFRNIAATRHNESKDRGRQNQEIHEPRSPADDEGGSGDRKGRWPKKLMKSRSSLSSEDSDSHPMTRHKRGRNHGDAALEKQMKDMLAKEAGENRGSAKGINGSIQKQGIPKQVGQAQSTDKNEANRKLLFQETPRRPKGPQRLNTDLPASASHLNPTRASLDEDRLGHRRMSSGDLDSTAPSSPTVSGFIPSIAINLSPPASPSTSALSPKKPLPARLGSFRHIRGRSFDKRAVSENDLTKDSDQTENLTQQATNESLLRNRLHKERTTESSNDLLSPISSENSSMRSRPLEVKPTRYIRDTNGFESKFRGLFKGGRIAELVGNEVSRVGDMFWRKENSSISSQIASPISSYASGDSDLDDGDISGLDSSPNENLSRVTTGQDGMDKLSRKSTNSEKPKYYMSNLPSFRSPFNRDEQSAKSPSASPDQDPIPRQQLAQRDRGRSSRFDRLAPPKIDMRGISPSPSPGQSRARSRGLDASRESSTSRSTRGVRDTDRRLNDMLGNPGKVGVVAGVPPPTGLSALASRKDASRERPALKEKRQWSISDRGISAVRGTLTKRDVARVRALLLSSGVKANEIARRAEEIPPNPSPLLQDLQDIIKGPVPRVPRSQEHLTAARILVSNIENANRQFRDVAEHFSSTVVDELHKQIKAIDECVTDTLTPLVRASADDADTFSTELTTTHTLAVKQLNDSMNTILRRRHRRLRWIRRGGWAMLEWTLLGVMWLVWLIVVIVRLIRGTLKGVVTGVKWLLFL